MPPECVQGCQGKGIAERMVITDKITVGLQPSVDPAVKLLVHLDPLRMANRKYRHHTIKCLCWKVKLGSKDVVNHHLAAVSIRRDVLLRFAEHIRGNIDQ